MKLSMGQLQSLIKDFADGPSLIKDFGRLDTREDVRWGVSAMVLDAF